MKRLFLFSPAVLVAALALSAAAGARGTDVAPASSSAPTVSGSPYVGKTLQASHGGWSNGPAHFTFQWARCTSTGEGCAPIPGATAASYSPVSADVGSTLEAWVTAANAAGTTGPVNSQPTSVITPALAPTDSALATVVGKPLVGATLLADPGSYGGGAVAQFAYQWQDCDPSTLLCTDISGATAQSYTAAGSDVGKRLRVAVEATNPYGQVSDSSAATGVVSVPQMRIATTLAASVSSTVCCQVVHLSGSASPAGAGEQITILARRLGQLASYPVATATTDGSGNWSAAVTPMIATRYTAQTSTSVSPAVAVGVHPRVGFGIAGNNFSAKITGLGSFAGKVAYFQTVGASGEAGTASLLVVINPGSVAHFHVALKRGHTYAVRIYLPQAQAGQGYLDGTSHTRRVGGAA